MRYFAEAPKTDFFRPGWPWYRETVLRFLVGDQSTYKPFVYTSSTENSANLNEKGEV